MINGQHKRSIQLALFRGAVAAGSRRLNDNGLIFVDYGGIAPLQLFHAAVLAPGPVFADLARLAAGQSERGHPLVSRQNRAFHFFEEADGAADAVAGVPLAASA